MSRRPDGRASIARRCASGPTLALGIFLAVLTASCAERLQPTAGSLRGVAIAGPVRAPDLVLTDTDGVVRDLQRETEGFVTLLFFGYTRCPDVCPVHMATLGAAYELLEPEVRSRIKVFFVSTDPEWDTPEALRAWLDHFDRTFVGLRGSVEQINEAVGSLGLPGIAVLPSEHGSDPPRIGHPSAIVAFGPDGLARRRYPFGMRRADWLHDLPLLAASS